MKSHYYLLMNMAFIINQADHIVDNIKYSDDEFEYVAPLYDHQAEVYTKLNLTIAECNFKGMELFESNLELDQVSEPVKCDMDCVLRKMGVVSRRKFEFFKLNIV